MLRSLACLVFLPIILAIATAIPAVAQEDTPKQCSSSDVPENVLHITEALNLCREVSLVYAASGGAAFFDKPDIGPDLRKIQAYLTLASFDLSDAIAALDQDTIDRNSKALANTTKLAIASAVIGIIGGGVGGGLHLVNDPHVGHNATLVGIGAGVLGGGIGVVNALKYGKTKQEEIDEKTRKGDTVRLYYRSKYKTDMSDSLLEKNPDEYAATIRDMSRQLRVLQQKVISLTDFSQVPASSK